MKQKRNHLTIAVVFFLLIVVLSSCQKSTQPQPTVTPGRPTSSSTPTSKPTSIPTPTPYPSLTATLAPTSTPSPSPTVEVFQDRLSYALTPLPPYLSVIQAPNIPQLREIALWGNGRVNDIILSPGGEQMVVATNLGAVIYDSTNFIRLTALYTSQPTQTLAFSWDDQWIALAVHPDQIWVYRTSEVTPSFQLSLAHWDMPEEHRRTIFFTQNNTQLVHVVQSQDLLLIDRWDTTNWQLLGSFSSEASPATYINPTLNIAGILIDGQLVLQSLVQPGESQSVPLAAAEPDAFWDQIKSILPGVNGDFLMMHTGEAVTHWQLLEEEFFYRIDNFPYQVPDPCADVPDTCLNQNGDIAWNCVLDEEDEKKPVETLDISPNELMFVLSKRSGTTECRQAFNGAFMWEIDSRYTQLAFSPNSEFFYGLLPDGTIEKRTTLDGILIMSLKEHPSQLFDLAFSPDGSIIAGGYSDGLIRIYSTWNGEMLGVLEGTATSLTFSSSGHQLAAGLSDGSIRVFELDLGRFSDLGDGHLAAVTDLAFFPDGQFLLTGSSDCTAGIWNITGRYRTLRLTPDDQNPFQISNVAIHPIQTNQYYSGGQKNGVFIYDNALAELKLLSSQWDLNDMSISNDGAFLGATGPGTWIMPLQPIPQTVRAQQLTSERPANGHALAFSPDSSLLTVATDQDLIFWSLPDGNEITYDQNAPFPSHNSLPINLLFNPEGSLLVLGSEDGLIHIWGSFENTIE